MCGTHGDHEHHHHEPEGAEQHLTNELRWRLTRRKLAGAFGASGLLIASRGISGGNALAASSRRPNLRYVAQGSDEFDGMHYLAGDHHIHTRYSDDGQYRPQRQIAEANFHRLDWAVITDHGGETHNKLGVDLTYPDILDGREQFKNMLVFVGVELNIPGAEHGTVMIEANGSEKDQVKAFEASYDGVIVDSTEEKAIEAMRALEAMEPKPLFFANHPARKGLDTPHELRAWKAAAPTVAVGFEGAPGHQAAGMVRDADGKIAGYRGGYGNKPGGKGAWAGFGAETYFTYGGFDSMTAKLGGLWDSILGDGTGWWITANSDSHRYFNDIQGVDDTQFDATGFVTENNTFVNYQQNEDFRPGEYSRNYTMTKDATYAGVMTALRSGSNFVVLGDLIDRLKFTADLGDAATAISLGGTLSANAGDNVRVTIKVRVPSFLNFNNQRPNVDHIDLIAGDVVGPSQDLDNMVNPTTKVVRTYARGDWHEQDGADGLVLSMDYTFEKVDHDFYIRLRGTNTDDRGETPAMDLDLRGQTGPADSPVGLALVLREPDLRQDRRRRHPGGHPGGLADRSTLNEPGAGARLVHSEFRSIQRVGLTTPGASALKEPSSGGFVDDQRHREQRQDDARCQFGAFTKATSHVLAHEQPEDG